ncbi:hypothetical protein DPEC_G00188230 [Dallia pectoralis]|uniref:Uncharacterized protein n=1 Tax=Dallia pectoralis TaxID=75939 RepID=A0ACC2GCD6_DALPE|nr:hypothetical protein DPEC_G00188230 [Dallia pectoralis]
MGEEAEDILVSLHLSPEEASEYETVKGKLDAHFVKRRNVIFERAKFNQRQQEVGESADSFHTALHCLAEHCGYGALHDEMGQFSRLEKSTRVLLGPGGTRLNVKGKFTATLRKNSKSTKEEIYVVEGLCTPLLGGLAAVALQLVARINNISLDSKETVKREFPKLFCGLDMDNLKRTEQKYREKLRQNHDQRHRARDMPCLQPGDHVWVKDTGERGTVVSTAGTPRSYIVETPGSTLRRNRYHLSPTPVAPGEPANLFEPAPESIVPCIPVSKFKLSGNGTGLSWLLAPEL